MRSQLNVFKGDAYSFRRWWALLVTLLLSTMLGGQAFAVDPDKVNLTLEGCRQTGGVPLTKVNGVLICPDTAYTTGNLGKGWSELDLVPHRVTAQTGTGGTVPESQTYTLAVVADYQNGNPAVLGYDFLTPIVLNTVNSTPGCNAPVVGAQTLAIPGLGGITKSVYRTLTVTQTRGKTCVYDYDARLAIGSHFFPGASLHSNLALVSPSSPGGITTSGIGARDVSIPVKEIAPQELSKTMTAVANSDSGWSLVKSSDPLSVNFGDVCAVGAPTSKTVDIKVAWTKTPTTNGNVVVTTSITVKNPASRKIIANVTDVIYAGTGQTNALDTVVFPPREVAANNSEVLTHSVVLSSAAAGVVGGALNDVATASYTDFDFPGVPVPGTTTAAASTIISAGLASNSNAIIYDTESITGAGLSFGLPAPAISGFLNYTANAKTTGPVQWQTTNPQTGTGFVVFNKTVYLDKPRVTSGTLSDTAALTAYNADGSAGTATSTASLAIGISSDATVKVGITKTLQGAPTLSAGQTIVITFKVSRTGSMSTQTRTLTFGPGETVKSLAAADLISGPPDLYTVTEESALFYPDASSSGQASGLGPVGQQMQVDMRLAADGSVKCADTASFLNSPQINAYARAQVKKTTVPAANDPGNWQFTLYAPNGAAIGVLSTVPGNSTFVGFADGAGPLALLAEGKYVVKETLVSGWDLTDVVTRDGMTNDCTFTINYPEDIGAIKSCAFTNTQRGKVKVVKTVAGQTPASGEAFVFELRSGATLTATGLPSLQSLTATSANGGVLSFTTPLVPGQTYQLCENVLAGWMTNLPSAFVPNSANPPVDNSVLCSNFSVLPGETKVIAVDNTRPPGGLALTIGYWKNWASCSASAYKKPVLDQTMALSMAYMPPGIQVGNFALVGDPANANVAPDCSKAVNLLNKSTMTNGKKSASDPLFNMTAQLVAAELNRVAGAGVCGPVATAIVEANALLALKAFTGDGHSALTGDQSSQANGLAKRLDDFNNDRPAACIP